MDDIIFIGDWIKDRVLGSGSFGTVVLWKHKNTDEKLAIKTCKWDGELTEKHKERWTKEVEMLQNCNNINIVSTKELPSEFVVGLERANPSKLPILCMEYCSGGDLRQQLNKPESCSGLKEKQVRQILRDIGNAMQFLHKNKITHRDLKPENIVLSLSDIPLNNSLVGQEQNNVTYKLIDLGYAKEIDSNSVCASFVGTLQYLAPEIFYSKTYSNSVDFWSFGLLAFEIIAGTRPFLPYLAPVQWMPYVKKKAHENICVYETFHGDIEYTNEIFPENNISNPFKSLMEEWLQIALEWDPKLRGRISTSKVTFNIPSDEKQSTNGIVIYSQLEKILNKKVVKVFSMLTLSTLAYVINDSTTIYTLKKWIHKDTNITLNDQIVMTFNSYGEVGNEELVNQYWNDSCKIIFYVYDKRKIMNDHVEPVVPRTVQRCLEHPKLIYNYKNSQNLYRHSLYFIMLQMEMYDSLINGLYIRGESLKSESKQLLLKHNTVDKNIGKLVTKHEAIMKMVEEGKKHIEALSNNGTATNYLGGFSKIFKDSDDLSEKVNKLQSAWTQLTVRLQSAARRSNEALAIDLNNFVAKYNFQIIVNNAIKAYISFKKNEYVTAHRSKEKQCSDVVKVNYDCLKLRSKILLELNNQPFILKLQDLTTEFTKINDIINSAAENTEKLSTSVETLSGELTQCMWSTITILSSDASNLTELPYSVISFEKRDFKIGDAVSPNCLMTKKNDELMSLIEESLKLRKNQVTLTKQLKTQKQMLNDAMLDFSFLSK